MGSWLLPSRQTRLHLCVNSSHHPLAQHWESWAFLLGAPPFVESPRRLQALVTRALWIVLCCSNTKTCGEAPALLSMHLIALQNETQTQNNLWFAFIHLPENQRYICIMVLPQNFVF